MTDLKELAPEGFASLEGKKIKLRIARPGHEEREATGKVDVANHMALIIKESGQTMTTLVEASWVVRGSIEEVLDKPRELKQRRLDPLGISNARHHLLDRHAWPIRSVNAMTDAEAMTQHALQDHGLLGHYHQSRDDLAAEVETEVSTDEE